MLIREHADASPTSCVACGGANEPMLDTESDIPGYGRVHLCIGTTDRPGCLLQALRESHAADPNLRGQLEQQIIDLARENDQLRSHAALADLIVNEVRTSGILVDPWDTSEPAPEPEPEPKPKATRKRSTR